LFGFPRFVSRESDQAALFGTHEQVSSQSGNRRNVIVFPQRDEFSLAYFVYGEELLRETEGARDIA
jgi:hypothetical protein